ncbi:MAG: hypothetical protein U0R65_02275 [Candidatus Nanopelagicales bacterium]
MQRPDERWRGPVHEVRAVLSTDRHVAVGFRLPVVDHRDARRVPGGRAPRPRSARCGLGLDAARRRLLEAPDRTIGEAPLDQRIVAGSGPSTGRMMLFVCGVHLLTPVGDVTDLEGLLTTARRLLRRGRPRPTAVDR